MRRWRVYLPARHQPVPLSNMHSHSAQRPLIAMRLRQRVGLRVVELLRPAVVLIETVPGIFSRQGVLPTACHKSQWSIQRLSGSHVTK